MNRRQLMKALGVMGMASSVPVMYHNGLLIPTARAEISAKRKLEARAILSGEFGYSAPAKPPQIIGVFLYGGASELAGNLTNIEEIHTNSQNPYPQDMRPDNNGEVAQRTENGFWANAGGRFMERMIAEKSMNVLRTLYRSVDDSKAHRPSIFSNLTGQIGEDDFRPGYATNLVSILAAHGVVDETSLFPLVTFEGESVVFNQSSNLPLMQHRPVTFNANFSNPYQRERRFADTASASIESLVSKRFSKTSDREGLRKILTAFDKRRELDEFISTNFSGDNINEMRTFDDPVEKDADGNPVQHTYPGGFGTRIHRAVSMLERNPSTMYVSVGNSGLGDWDDHNGAMDDYPGRMNNLMQSLFVASKHLQVKGMDHVRIVVFSDFGRNTNLNNSMGWDHGNNQCLYIVGAPQSNGVGSLSQSPLGKVIGKTVREGQSKVNRQFTVPTDDSYHTPPFSVAASIYSYFGIEDPSGILTSGYGPVDERFAPSEVV